MVALVTINYNDAETTEKFVRGISDYKNIDHIVVVDNKSTDDSYERLKKLENLKISVIETERNGGYAYGNNRGIEKAKSQGEYDYFIISNSDVRFGESTVDAMLETMESNNRIAVVAPTMMDAAGKICSNVAANLPTYGDVISECFLGFKLIRYKLFGITNCIPYERIATEKLCQADIVPGSLFMIDRNALTGIGFFDERTFLYNEENILGYKLKKAGHTEALLPQQFYIHKHGSSIRKNISKWSKHERIKHESTQVYLSVSGCSAIKKKLFLILFFIGMPERYIVSRIIDLKKDA